MTVDSQIEGGNPGQIEKEESLTRKKVNKD